MYIYFIFYVTRQTFNGILHMGFVCKCVSHLVSVSPGRSALQSFTVRCAALAARIEDPYIDTTMKVKTWSFSNLALCFTLQLVYFNH